MKTTPKKRSISAALVSGILFFLLYFTARAFLESPDMSPTNKVLIALMPVPVFAVFLWTFIKELRGADELHRRVHLEALAVAFPLTLLLLMILGLLQRAIELPFEDWSYLHVWQFLPIFYFGGLALAWRRYK